MEKKAGEGRKEGEKEERRRERGREKKAVTEGLL